MFSRLIIRSYSRLVFFFKQPPTTPSLLAPPNVCRTPDHPSHPGHEAEAASLRSGDAADGGLLGEVVRGSAAGERGEAEGGPAAVVPARQGQPEQRPAGVVPRHLLPGGLPTKRCVCVFPSLHSIVRANRLTNENTSARGRRTRTNAFRSVWTL